MENEKSMDDYLLEQMVNQLKRSDCELAYCQYKDALDTLSKSMYNYDAIILISNLSTSYTTLLISNMTVIFTNNSIPTIPYCVAFGNC